MKKHPVLLQCNDKRPDGTYIATVTEELICLDQLKVVVKWLNSDCTEHNLVPSDAPHYLKHLKRLHCPKCWQSLLDAVKEK